MKPLDIPDELVGQPFTVATARAAGISWKVLQGQRFVCVGRGVYLRRDGVTAEACLIRAALLTLPPPTLVTGVSGLRLLGVMVGSPDPLHFVSTHPRQVRRQGLRVTRVSSLPPHHDSVVNAEHCWVVAARELTLLDLVTAGDWLVRAKLTTLPTLKAYVEASSIRGGGPARAAIGLVRDRVDSVRETARYPRLVVRRVYEALCDGGYRGPEPVFDQRWMALFEK